MVYDNPLSNEDIERLLHSDVSIIDYSEFKNIDKIEDIFKKSNNVVVLYRWSLRIGHWVALIRHSNYLIEFFDSFGSKPDGPLLHWSPALRQEILGQDKPYMNILLYKWMSQNRRHKLLYNEYTFQSKSFSTCGRWVVFRIWHADMPLSKFIKKYKDLDDDDIIAIINKLKY